MKVENYFSKEGLEALRKEVADLPEYSDDNRLIQDFKEYVSVDQLEWDIDLDLSSALENKDHILIEVSGHYIIDRNWEFSRR